PGKETTYFGQKTLTAVRKYQAVQGFVPANVVGVKTRAALNKYLGVTPATPPASQTPAKTTTPPATPKPVKTITAPTPAPAPAITPNNQRAMVQTLDNILKALQGSGNK
ncbi:MAG: hypothetical protein NTY81_01675, partial [Candidatus Staskawiczbacteria bacterium]|nr:hypothetical protein [Candidatus Staskawiczbacteria bacterium]